MDPIFTDYRAILTVILGELQVHRHNRARLRHTDQFHLPSQQTLSFSNILGLSNILESANLI